MYLLVAVLNILDYILTYYLFHIGLIAEANPIMRPLLYNHPILLLLLKIIIIPVCIYFLWIYREVRISKISIKLVFVAYFFVVIYELCLLIYSIRGV